MRRRRETNQTPRVIGRRMVLEALETRRVLDVGWPRLAIDDIPTYGSVENYFNVSDGGKNSPHAAVVIDERAYFVVGANESENVTYVNFDSELWTTDGTPAGTQIVPQIDLLEGYLAPAGPLFFTVNQGEEWQGSLFFQGVFVDPLLEPPKIGFFRSDPDEQPTLLKQIDVVADSFDYFPLGARLLFQANDGASGAELWSTDGTPSGTVLVKDITPGAAGSTISAPVQVGSSAYFAVKSGGQWTSLWKTDGTSAGTALVATLPGPLAPQSFRPLGNRVLFYADTPALGNELWSSDGTSSGTAIVKDIRPGSADGLYGVGSRMTVFRGEAYFAADDGTDFTELWKSDGTSSGTQLFLETSGPFRSGAFSFQPLGDRLLIGSGRNAWITDGSSAGTQLIQDESGFSADPYWQGVVDSQALFFKGSQVWGTNGTSSGTVLLGSVPFPHQTVISGNLWYFTSPVGSDSTELWRSDGTASGTLRLGAFHRESGDPTSLGGTSFQGGLLFFADDGVHGREPWFSDGTVTGTHILRDIGNSPTEYFDRNWVASTGERSLFAATSPEAGRELWVSDGSATGASLLVDLVLGPTGSNPRSFVNVSGTVYFTADDAYGYRRLWKTDGTVSGTVKLAPTYPSMGLNSPDHLTNVNGTLFFSGYQGFEHKLGLWVSDGTLEGTVPVPAAGSGDYLRVSDILALGNRALIATYDPQSYANDQLWISDGTSAGTTLLRDFSPGHVQPLSLRSARFGEDSLQLMFEANDGVSGNELWRTDGTSNNTQLVADLTPGATESSFLGPLVPWRGEVFFTTFNSGVYRSDGTSTGTIFILSNEFDSQFIPEASLAETIIGAGGNINAGSELWKFDGTSTGVALIRDIDPGVRSSYPEGFIDVDGLLYFFARNATNQRRDLWRTDGTSGGTRRIAEAGLDLHLRFGSNGGYVPLNVMNVNGQLFFIGYGNDGARGIYALPRSQPPTTSGLGPIAAEAGGVPAEISLSGAFADNEQTSPTLRYSITSTGGATSGLSLTIDQQTDRLTITAAAGMAGQATALIRATDAGGLFVETTLVIHVVPEFLPGDANHDGTVGTADYAIWAAQFGQMAPGLAADFDNNGEVGAGDYAIWAANFGRTSTSAAQPTAAPFGLAHLEPAAFTQTAPETPRTGPMPRPAFLTALVGSNAERQSAFTSQPAPSRPQPSVGPSPSKADRLFSQLATEPVRFSAGPGPLTSAVETIAAGGRPRPDQVEDLSQGVVGRKFTAALDRFYGQL